MATIDRARQVWDDAASWPSFAQTARLLAIDRSTLTKHARAGQIVFVVLGFGRGERRVPPAEVIRLAEQYHRVPVGEVRRGLARDAARRFRIDESELLRGLNDLFQAWLGQIARSPTTDLAAIGPSNASPVTAGHTAEGVGEPARPRGRATRQIDLGPLRPRVVAREGIPSPEFLAALDARTPHRPEIEVERGTRREIDLGPLRPGMRF